MRSSLAACIGLLLIPTCCAAQSMPNAQAVVSSTRAYVLLPPDLVCGPTVTQVSVAPSGNCAVLVQTQAQFTAQNLADFAAGHMPEPDVVSIILWNCRSRVSHVVWRAEGVHADVREIDWLPTRDVAYVLTSEYNLENNGGISRESLLRLTTALDSADVVEQLSGQGAQIFNLDIAPERPRALLTCTVFTPPPPGATGGKTRTDQRLELLDSAGESGGRASLASDTMLRNVHWTAGGEPVAQLMRRGVKSAEQPKSWLQIGWGTGKIEELPKQPEFATARPEPPLPLHTRLERRPEGPAGRPVKLLWLIGTGAAGPSEALVSGDATSSMLPASCDGLVYESQGAAWYQPLFPMSLADYTELAKATRRRVALDHAKQIGLALLMYAADYDEVLPSGDLAGRIDPYLRDSGMLGGFQYTFSGGPLSGIANPSLTQLGTIATQDGSAVVWADGHASWIAAPGQP